MANANLSAAKRALKGASSRRLKNDFPKIQKCYYKGVLWSPSYYAVSAGGASLETLKKYIEKQREKSKWRLISSP